MRNRTTEITGFKMISESACIHAKFWIESIQNVLSFWSVNKPNSYFDVYTVIETKLKLKKIFIVSLGFTACLIGIVANVSDCRSRGFGFDTWVGLLLGIS